MTQKGEAGIYRVTSTSKMKSSIVIAIGRTETRGEVLSVGAARGECPATLANEESITDIRASQLMGMTEKAAEVCAAASGWLYRVGERDGEQFALTRDYRTNRVTVSVTSGTISAIAVG
jgi:hypothetical protein